MSCSAAPTTRGRTLPRPSGPVRPPSLPALVRSRRSALTFWVRARRNGLRPASLEEDRRRRQGAPAQVDPLVAVVAPLYFGSSRAIFLAVSKPERRLFRLERMRSSLLRAVAQIRSTKERAACLVSALRSSLCILCTPQELMRSSALCCLSVRRAEKAGPSQAQPSQVDLRLLLLLVQPLAPSSEPGLHLAQCASILASRSVNADVAVRAKAREDRARSSSLTSSCSLVSIWLFPLV